MKIEKPTNPISLQKEVERFGSVVLKTTGKKSGMNQLPLLARQMMRVAMGDPLFRSQLFRLVDVFPTLGSDHEIVSHLKEYLEIAKVGSGASKFASLGTKYATQWTIPRAATVGLTKRNLEAVARHFIAGTDAKEVGVVIDGYRSDGLLGTVDVLGEKTLTEAEAATYGSRVEELAQELATVGSRWSSNAILDRDSLGEFPKSSISIKSSALSPHYHPLSSTLGVGEAKGRIESILGSFPGDSLVVFLDMEDYETKPLTWEVFKTLVENPKFYDYHLGIVVQVYLRDALEDLERLTLLSDARVGSGGTPLWVRVVKGAYFDSELVKAEADGYETPTFKEKMDSDYNFERAVDYLLGHIGRLRLAFGTHNVRSISYLHAKAAELQIPDTDYEIQMLYGMADELARTVAGLGKRVRMYVPMGELIPGMSYLVRRLLENTANEGFLRQGFASKSSFGTLLSAPKPSTDYSRSTNESDDAFSLDHPYKHLGVLEFHLPKVRAVFDKELQIVASRAKPKLGRTLPFIGGRYLEKGRPSISVNPTNPEEIVSEVLNANSELVDEAVSAAKTALSDWSRTPVASRANYLLAAARWMRDHRYEISAIEIIEAGKPWKEADADVVEAIDFCNYYAHEMKRLGSGVSLLSPKGEHNDLHYRPKGVAAVIGPWNFPLAIPTGMVVAALVAGNTVVLKPAEQTPATAKVIVEAFRAAGLPDGVLNFLPGDGEEVGAQLVRHKDVALIAFTGSRSVGLEILETASKWQKGQVHIKKVIAELGGKDAIVVDADADLDQVVPGVIYSTFGFSGQKCSACSRLILLRSNAEEVLSRVIGAMHTLVVGDPLKPETDMGPLIDLSSQQRLIYYGDIVQRQGELVMGRSVVPAEGYFVPPSIALNLPTDSPVLTEEIFGPLLAVEIAEDLEEAVWMANSTDYALTAGLYSRSPKNIAFIRDELIAGNIYINRQITGAIPGRHPFGGFKMSGIGSKSGGPDYLLQFLDPYVVSENTLRQGFTPDIVD